MLAVTVCLINATVSVSSANVFCPKEDTHPVDTGIWNRSWNTATVRGQRQVMHGSWRTIPSGACVIDKGTPTLPGCFPCVLPDDSRRNRSLLASLRKLSLLGGFEEFFDVLSSRKRNEATRRAWGP